MLPACLAGCCDMALTQSLESNCSQGTSLGKQVINFRRQDNLEAILEQDGTDAPRKQKKTLRLLASSY